MSLIDRYPELYQKLTTAGPVTDRQLADLEAKRKECLERMHEIIQLVPSIDVDLWKDWGGEQSKIKPLEFGDPKIAQLKKEFPDRQAEYADLSNQITSEKQKRKVLVYG